MGLIMRRNLMAAKSGYTAKDYVQDGLVAMWDGIENAGWGVHDQNATTWKDLVSDIPATLEQCEVGDDFVLFSSASRSRCVLPSSYMNLVDNHSSPSVEIVYDCENPRYLVFAGRIGIGMSQAKAQMICAYGESVQQPPFRVSNKFSVIYSDSLNGFIPTAYSYGENVETQMAGSNRWNGTGGVGIGYWPNEIYATEGKIKNIRVYNCQLSASEIAANYAIDKARFNLT